MSPRAPVRILIVDDDRSVRAALSDLVRSDGRLEVAAVTGDGPDAVRLAEEHRPDVAVVDVKLPGEGGPWLAERIREVSPDTQVVAISAWDDPESAAQMRSAGAVAYVVKGTPSDDLLATLHRHGTAYARRRVRKGG